MVFLGDEDAVLDLVRRSREGERRAFDELLRLYRGRALGFVTAMIGNFDEAKDILQEGFLRAYEHIGGFRGDAKFQTWLYRILVNLTRDKIRRNRRARKIFEPMDDPRGEGEGPREFADNSRNPQKEFLRREAAGLIDEAIRELPEQQRLVFSLRHIDGMKLGEIAEVLGCRTGTVKAHLFRATQALRLKLAFYARNS